MEQTCGLVNILLQANVSLAKHEYIPTSSQSHFVLTISGIYNNGAGNDYSGNMSSEIFIYLGFSTY